MAAENDLGKFVQEALEIQEKTLLAMQEVNIKLARLEEWRTAVDADRSRGWQVKLAMTVAFMSLLSQFVLWALAH